MENKLFTPENAYPKLVEFIKGCGDKEGYKKALELKREKLAKKGISIPGDVLYMIEIDDNVDLNSIGKTWAGLGSKIKLKDGSKDVVVTQQRFVEWMQELQTQINDDIKNEAKAYLGEGYKTIK